jgi:hypothetical protein
MSLTLYFENNKTGKKFRVVSIDKEQGTITLKGDHAEFTEAYDKDRFKSMGYQLKRKDEDDDDAE